MCSSSWYYCYRKQDTLTQEINRLAAQYPVFAKAWEEIRPRPPLLFQKCRADALYALVYQYGWYCVLRSMGLEYCSAIATGIGRLTRQLIAGSLSLEQVMASLAAGTESTSRISRNWNT